MTPNTEKPPKKEQNDLRMWDRALVAFEKGCAEITKISKVGKLKLDTTKIQKERDDLFKKLGRETFEMVKTGNFELGKVEGTINQLNELMQKHSEQTDQIKKMSSTAGRKEKAQKPSKTEKQKEEKDEADTRR